MANHLKFCSCRMCRYYKHYPANKTKTRLKIRANRRKTKVDLRTGRETTNTISADYTD